MGKNRRNTEGCGKKKKDLSQRNSYCDFFECGIWKTTPDHWSSCLLIDRGAMCQQVRADKNHLYRGESGKSYPQEILDEINAFNAEGASNLETDTYAADVSDECLYHKGWQWPCEDRCVHQRWG